MDDASGKARQAAERLGWGRGFPQSRKGSQPQMSLRMGSGLGARTDPVPRSKGEDPATARAVDDDGYEATWISWHELAAAEAKKGLALSPMPACRPRGLASMMDAMPELIFIIRSSS